MASAPVLIERTCEQSRTHAGSQPLAVEAARGRDAFATASSAVASAEPGEWLLQVATTSGAALSAMAAAAVSARRALGTSKSTVTSAR
jgi:hypothetical protein